MSSGSKAEEVVNAIRVDNPEFAVYKKKKKEDKKDADAQPEKETNLKEEEEF